MDLACNRRKLDRRRRRFVYSREGEHFDGRVPVGANTRRERRSRLGGETTRVECETSYTNIPHFPGVRQRASYDVGPPERSSAGSQFNLVE